MPEIKRCPFKMIQMGKYSDYYRCEKEDCAWWILDLEMCAITAIALKDEKEGVR